MDNSVDQTEDSPKAKSMGEKYVDGEGRYVIIPKLISKLWAPPGILSAGKRAGGRVGGGDFVG